MMNGASGLQPFEQGWNHVKILLSRLPEAVGTVKKPEWPISIPSAVTADAARASAVLFACSSGVSSSGVAVAEPHSSTTARPALRPIVSREMIKLCVVVVDKTVVVIKIARSVFWGPH